MTCEASSFDIEGDREFVIRIIVRFHSSLAPFSTDTYNDIFCYIHMIRTNREYGYNNFLAIRIFIVCTSTRLTYGYTLQKHLRLTPTLKKAVREVSIKKLPQKKKFAKGQTAHNT